jgi:uncharacterized Zn finger protein (UPF0148 family)
MIVKCPKCGASFEPSLSKGVCPACGYSPTMGELGITEMRGVIKAGETEIKEVWKKSEIPLIWSISKPDISKVLDIIDHWKRIRVKRTKPYYEEKVLGAADFLHYVMGYPGEYEVEFTDIFMGRELKRKGKVIVNGIVRFEIMEERA